MGFSNTCIRSHHYSLLCTSWHGTVLSPKPKGWGRGLSAQAISELTMVYCEQLRVGITFLVANAKSCGKKAKPHSADEMDKRVKPVSPQRTNPVPLTVKITAEFSKSAVEFGSSPLEVLTNPSLLGSHSWFDRFSRQLLNSISLAWEYIVSGTLDHRKMFILKFKGFVGKCGRFSHRDTAVCVCHVRCISLISLASIGSGSNSKPLETLADGEKSCIIIIDGMAWQSRVHMPPMTHLLPGSRTGGLIKGIMIWLGLYLYYAIPT